MIDNKKQIIFMYFTDGDSVIGMDGQSIEKDFASIKDVISSDQTSSDDVCDWGELGYVITQEGIHEYKDGKYVKI